MAGFGSVFADANAPAENEEVRSGAATEVVVRFILLVLAPGVSDEEVCIVVGCGFRDLASDG